VTPIYDGAIVANASQLFKRVRKIRHKRVPTAHRETCEPMDS